jgi:hypothetical protein
MRGIVGYGRRRSRASGPTVTRQTYRRRPVEVGRVMAGVGAEPEMTTNLPTAALTAADRMRAEGWADLLREVMPPAYTCECGRFTHRCSVRGADASFGYGVSLRRGELGDWRCWEHRRTPATANTYRVPGRGTLDEACNLPSSTCTNEYRDVR